MAGAHIATMDWSTIVGIIGAIVTLSTVFVATWWTKKSSRKALTYGFTAAKLNNLKVNFTGDLKITFKDRDVADASLVSLTVKNSGRSPIERVDFDGNLQLLFDSSSEILAAQISRTFPRKLSVMIAVAQEDSEEPSRIRVDPLLLNPGDWFTILALVSRFGGSVMAHGRIAGVREIQNEANDRENRGTFWAALGGVALISAVTLLSISVLHTQMQVWQVVLAISVTGVLGILACLLFLLAALVFGRQV